jgi:putative DNA primase/helicase
MTFWYGNGANGKSLLANLVLYILGDYGCKGAPNLLFRGERCDRHPTELTDLHGRRFVMCNETKNGRAWDEGTIKDLTGGDRIRAHRMYEDFWEFDPTHKIAVFGNRRPRMKDMDGGIGRRFQLVPFNVSFRGREDRTLDERLRKEASGVLNWLVEGCLAWQRHGLPEVKAVQEATTEYLHEEDTLGQFCDAELVFGSQFSTTRKSLYEHYVDWTEGRGEERPRGPRAIAEILRQRGVKPWKVRTKEGPRDGWVGVSVRSSLPSKTQKTGRNKADLRLLPRSD